MKRTTQQLTDELLVLTKRLHDLAMESLRDNEDYGSAEHPAFVILTKIPAQLRQAINELEKTRQYKAKGI